MRYTYLYITIYDYKIDINVLVACIIRFIGHIEIKWIEEKND